MNDIFVITVNLPCPPQYQQFVPGMKVEIDDELRPYQVWVANILENYGGRLQLRYDTPNPEEPTFWLFYTSPRIHPFGWTKSQGTFNTILENEC